jgi:hypothetical protein
MTAIAMLIIAAGVVLIWAAIKGRDPRDLIGAVIRR